MAEEDYLGRLASYVKSRDRFDTTRWNNFVTNFFPGFEEALLEPSESDESSKEIPPDQYPYVTNSAYDRTYEQFED